MLLNDRLRYLNADNNKDWMQVLITSLELTRISWNSDWVGLTTILECCIEKLINPSDQDHLPNKKILDCAHYIANEIEINARTNLEPHYHNRLHISDALTSLSVLLLIEKKRSGHLNSYWTSILLLAITAHDYLHPGGNNKIAFEIEDKSLNSLDAIWFKFSLDEQSKHFLRHIIRHTDPVIVPKNHSLVKDKLFEFNLNWATVLVNESDILASCTSEFGYKLSLQLAEEWKSREVLLHKEIATTRGRKYFLQSIQFSSPSSQILEINKSIQCEIDKLL